MYLMKLGTSLNLAPLASLQAFSFSKRERKTLVKKKREWRLPMATA